jgi:creatinine amidohydrolase/Fe(II)-dependent formamide hydrolase-like protein
MDAPPILRWESLTKSAFDRLDPARCVVLVTCSPIEVHGPHLPLGADALEGQGLAERTLRFLPERHRERSFLQLPFVYAATDVVPQRGSLFFRPATTARVLEDLGGTLAAQGQRRDPSRFLEMLRDFRAGIRFFERETYSGAPAGASAELGERILDTFGREAAAAVSAILDGTLAPTDCHSPLWRWRFLFLNPVAIRVANRLLGFRNGIA